MRPDEYFMAFTLEGHDHPEVWRAFHCTLIYFGQMTELDLSDAISTTDAFFYMKEKTKLPHVTFSEEDFFGKEKNVRVLKAFNMEKARQALLEDLIIPLAEHRKGDDFGFNPHLTTQLTEITGKFDKLHLFKNRYEVIKTWELK